MTNDFDCRVGLRSSISVNNILNMPEIKQIVEMAKRAGWVYEGSQDLLSIGFEYAYLLVFHKN